MGNEHRADTDGMSDGNARRLANLRPPWQPGECGNPENKGREKPDLVAVLRDVVKAMPEVSGESAEQIVVKALLKAGLKGGGTALKELVDRVFGPVAQAYMVEGMGGIRVIISKADEPGAEVDPNDETEDSKGGGDGVAD